MSGTDDWGVGPEGYKRPTYEEVLAELKANVRRIAGQQIDLTSNSVYGQLVQHLARLLIILLTEGEAVYDSRFLRTAAGVSLDRLAEEKQIARNPATYAIGSVNFSRDSPASQTYQIPAGTQVSTADRMVQYVTTEPGTIEEGAMTSEAVPIIAALPGRAYNLAAYTISAITTPVLGVDRVTNPAATTGGSDTESDAVFRSRIRTYKQSAKATLAAYEATLRDLDGVVSVNIHEDAANATVQIYVLGGDDTEIADAIESTRAAGISSIWARPSEVIVNVTGTVSGNAAGVTEAISAYFADVEVGEDVTYSALIAAAMQAEGAALLSLSATANGRSIQSLGESIVINYDSLAVAGLITISE